MKIINSQIQTNFKSDSVSANNKKRKPEFIDKLLSEVKNPDDVNNCVAVPRGIFKAYMWIMGGSALLSLSNIVPAKSKVIKNSLIAAGTVANFISGIYFAKPFFMKDLSPTIDINKNNK